MDSTQHHATERSDTGSEMQTNSISVYLHPDIMQLERFNSTPHRQSSSRCMIIHLIKAKHFCDLNSAVFFKV